MARREIEFVIDANGEVQIRVHGVAGAQCEALTRDVEQALGVVTDRQRTSEFWQQATASQQAQQRYGAGDPVDGAAE